MNEDVHFLESVKKEVLDTYLSFGWYRTGRLIFTVHTLEPYRDGRLFRVLWLRYLVRQVNMTKQARKIIELNKQFSVVVRPFSITDDVAELHKKYVANLKFETAKNLNDLLQDVENKVYDSYIIEVRDNKQLIAAGIFDKGTEAIAGIINFYDPEYKKYSPGKYVMALKYLYCLDKKIKYYYPGYFSPEYPAFDYKLFLDTNATEVFIPEGNIWFPYNVVFSK